MHVTLLADFGGWAVDHWAFLATTIHASLGANEQCVIFPYSSHQYDGIEDTLLSSLEICLQKHAVEIQKLSIDNVASDSWKASKARYIIFPKSIDAVDHAVKTCADAGSAFLHVWTHHGGLYTANPARVQFALLIHSLSFAEAADHGAPPLSPVSLRQLEAKSIGVQFYSPLFGPGATVRATDALHRWIAGPTAHVWRVPVADAAALSSKALFTSISGTAALVALPSSGPMDSTAEAIPSATLLALHGVDAGTAAALATEAHGRVLAVAPADHGCALLVDGLDTAEATLHEALFPSATNAIFAAHGQGPSWGKLSGTMEQSEVMRIAAETDDTSVCPATDRWWWDNKEKLIEMTPAAVPIYVYNLKHIRSEIAKLHRITAIGKLFFAMKANFNEDVLLTVEAAGVNFECVSLGEIDHITRLFPHIAKERILFTPNFAPQSEYEYALKLGVHVTVDNAYCIEHWPHVFSGHKILLRCEIGEGQGHHAHVKTGSSSKFGVTVDALPSIAKLCAHHNITVTGLHAHSGSGIIDAGLWAMHAEELSKLARRYFPTAKTLNLGGGLGHAYLFNAPCLDIDAVEQRLSEAVKVNHLEDWELWLEPGRRIVAGCGVILTRVTQIKEKKSGTYVGVSAGMHNLIRPALYGSHHAIVNLSRDGVRHLVNVCGPICESADVLGRARAFPVDTAEGDVVLVDSVGAYGSCMSSLYNMRGPADEIAIDFVHQA